MMCVKLQCAVIAQCTCIILPFGMDLYYTYLSIPLNIKTYICTEHPDPQCMVPQIFILRPHLLKSIDKVYHKHEARFLLYILGQVVT